MFQSMKNNLGLGVIGLLAVALLLTGISLFSVKASLKVVQSELASAQLSASILQSDLDVVTASLVAAETEKKRLRQAAELTESLLGAREHGRVQVDVLLSETNAKASAMIKGAKDDAVKTWANTAVPVELNQLLKQAAHCANRANPNHTVCIAATGIDEHLPSAGVLRPEQSGPI